MKRLLTGALLAAGVMWLVVARGGLSQNLIALYKAMGGGWDRARSLPVVDDAPREMMNQRSDWNDVLSAPLPPPGSDARATSPGAGKP